MTLHDRMLNFGIATLVIAAIAGISLSLYLGIQSDILITAALCLAITLACAGLSIIIFKHIPRTLSAILILIILIVSAVSQYSLLDGDILAILNLFVWLCTFGIGFTLLVKDDPSFLN